MNFAVIAENWRYLLFGTFPDGPLEGAALTLLISLLAGGISIFLGIAGGIALAMLKGWWANLLAAVLGFSCYTGHHVDFLELLFITCFIRHGYS